MIAIDTSSLVAFLQNEVAEDVELIVDGISKGMIVIPPIVIAEIFCARNITKEAKESISRLPRLAIKDGYWERAGEMRMELLTAGKKARLADTLIAAYCLDHDLEIVTRDNDYRHFSNHFGLKLIVSRV